MEERSLVSVLALNTKGQLGRICNFFAENNLNILRLVLSAADKGDVIHRTIAYIEGDRKYVNEMCDKLRKMENVLDVENFMSNDNFIERELCLIKTLEADINYNNIVNLVYDYNGKMLIAKNGVIIFQLVDMEENISKFCKLLNRITNDIEVYRSGMLATSIKDTRNYDVVNNYIKNIKK